MLFSETFFVAPSLDSDMEEKNPMNSKQIEGRRTSEKGRAGG